MFEKFCSKNFEQQLQVQHEKSFHLVPLEMVARRVSRELFGMWTSKRCFHIQVHIHSKCMIEKPKNQLSEKLMRGGERVMRPSHCKIIRLWFSFCSALEKSGVSGGRIFDPKKNKKTGEFLSNLTLSRLTMWLSHWCLQWAEATHQIRRGKVIKSLRS